MVLLLLNNIVLGRHDPFMPLQVSSSNFNRSTFPHVNTVSSIILITNFGVESIIFIEFSYINQW